MVTRSRAGADELATPPLAAARVLERDRDVKVLGDVQPAEGVLELALARVEVGEGEREPKRSSVLLLLGRLSAAGVSKSCIGVRGSVLSPPQRRERYGASRGPATLAGGHHSGLVEKSPPASPGSFG